jgi:hypothetical protein
MTRSATSIVFALASFALAGRASSPCNSHRLEAFAIEN